MATLVELQFYVDENLSPRDALDEVCNFFVGNHRPGTEVVLAKVNGEVVKWENN